MSWLGVLERIGVRTGVALWRQRVVVIGGGLIVAALGVYELTVPASSAPVSGSDCADTAMLAVTHVDDASAHAVYDCLGSTMRTTSEDQFIAGMKAHSAPSGEFDRVADKTMQDGGRIVFFTVHAGGAP